MTTISQRRIAIDIKELTISHSYHKRNCELFIFIEESTFIFSLLNFPFECPKIYLQGTLDNLAPQLNISKLNWSPTFTLQKIVEMLIKEIETKTFTYPNNKKIYTNL